jgi:fido (protein-threonine AMPylation protein)
VYEWAGSTRDEKAVLSDRSIATEPDLRKLGRRRFLQGLQIAATLKRVTDKLRNENRLRGPGRADSQVVPLF